LARSVPVQPQRREE